MDIGIPKEARPREHRVALAPSGVRTLVQQGHRVWVESDAGLDAGHPNSAYEAAGAQIAYSRDEVLGRAKLVATVYAPLARDYAQLEKDQVVCGFWALPATRPEDFKALLARGITAVGIEAIEDAAGHAPVRTSMSEIAGSLAVTLGSSFLLNEFGGKGILLGGVAGVPPAHFVIFGAGVLGRAAARAAIGLGAQVTLLDRSVGILREVRREVPAGYNTMLATRPNIEMALSFADLVLGAVAVSGQRPPILVTRDMLRHMKPRTVVMDLSIDMGGCFETSRPTSLASPTYEVDGILREVRREVPAGYTTMLATRPNIEMALSFADLVLGAVAVSGQRPPILVTRDMLRHMKPRTVVMDLSIDMGGCFETSRPTSLASPTYEVDGILHMCVPNLPSVAARTSTKAFTNATLPYLQTIAEQGIEGAVKAHPDLARGILLYRGQCANEALARSFGVDWRPVPVGE